MTESVRYVEVCDMPYYTEPDIFYERRMQEKMHIRALRFYAAFLFQKLEEELTVREYKLAFLEKFPCVILIDGSPHEVAVKKHKGEWCFLGATTAGGIGWRNPRSGQNHPLLVSCLGTNVPLITEYNDDSPSPSHTHFLKKSISMAKMAF